MWREVAQTFAEVDYLREMTIKKPYENGDYGSFMYLLLFYVIVDHAH